MEKPLAVLGRPHGGAPPDASSTRQVRATDGARRGSAAETVETGGREGAADLHQALLGRLGRGIDLAVHRLGDAGALARALSVTRLLVTLRTPRSVVAARLLLTPSPTSPTGEMAG